MSGRHLLNRLIKYDWWRGWICHHKELTSMLICILAFIALFPQLMNLVITFMSCTAGILLCQHYFSTETLLPNLLVSHERSKQKKTQDEELTLLKKICPVCGKEKCNRHRPELNIVALQPWSNLKIPKAVDDALEEFYTLILKEHVYSWYRDLSGQDEAFVDEVRNKLRFITAVLVRRVLKSDLPTLILGKVMKAAVKHLHFYLEVRKKKGKPDMDIEQALLDYYNGDLHCAVRSRRAELNFLKSLTEKIFPFILPRQSLKCSSLCTLVREIFSGAILLPLIDVLADPDTVNHLLLVFLDKSTPPISAEPPSPLVTLLHNFAQPLAKNESSLHLGITEILTQPGALFPFMQFMKSEASVNVLQFYLSVEEFNTKLLSPDLSDDVLERLHHELRDMYRIYCDPNAVDRIQFDADITDELNTICNGPPSGVVKLQTTTPLFRAYDHAYQLLESTFLPLFHQSDDYYQFLCGQRIPTRLPRTDSRSGSRKDALSFSRIGSKIKGVFKATTGLGNEAGMTQVDGKVEDDLDYGTDVESEDEFNSFFPCSFNNDGLLRDLSAWRVTIPSRVTKPDPENPRKTVCYFVIDIRRVDVLEGDFEASNWTVERRYHEFYVLEQKLTEFHGDFEEIQLPPKKLVGTRSQDFLESKRQAFEVYLQKLLTRPSLRGSELLFNFLAREEEFTSSILPDINLGKMVKSGAMKLVKERGQHLEPFLLSLLASVERPKPRSSRWTDSDSDTISISSEKMTNSIFENNANIEVPPSPSTPHKHVCCGSDTHISGVFDTLVFLAEKVHHCPTWFHHILMTLRILGQSTLDTFVDWYLGYKLHVVSREHRLVRLIHLVRDVLFFDNNPPRSEEDKIRRKKETLSQLLKLYPKMYVDIVGQQNVTDGTRLVLELLQQPKLNKQLAYMLLDEILADIFPELVTEEDSDLYKELNGR